MKLSICIPTYNRPELALKAIESVLCQNFSNFELLIHDNSENTFTENKIKQFTDNRIKYFRHPNNIGIAGNWNSLLEKASCTYVKFLNDDDQLLPGSLSRIANFITEIEKVYGEIGAISCRAISIRAFVEKIHQLTGSGTELKFGAVPYRDGEVMYSNADLGFLKSLGWDGKVSLEQGIVKTIGGYAE